MSQSPGRAQQPTGRVSAARGAEQAASGESTQPQSSGFPSATESRGWEGKARPGEAHETHGERPSTAGIPRPLPAGPPPTSVVRGLYKRPEHLSAAALKRVASGGMDDQATPRLRDIISRGKDAQRAAMSLRALQAVRTTSNPALQAAALEAARRGGLAMSSEDEQDVTFVLSPSHRAAIARWQAGSQRNGSTPPLHHSSSAPVGAASPPGRHTAATSGLEPVPSASSAASSSSPGSEGAGQRNGATWRRSPPTGIPPGGVGTTTNPYAAAMGASPPPGARAAAAAALSQLGPDTDAGSSTVSLPAASHSATSSHLQRRQQGKMHEAGVPVGSSLLGPSDSADSQRLQFDQPDQPQRQFSTQTGFSSPSSLPTPVTSPLVLSPARPPPPLQAINSTSSFASSGADTPVDTAAAAAAIAAANARPLPGFAPVPAAGGRITIPSSSHPATPSTTTTTTTTTTTAAAEAAFPREGREAGLRITAAGHHHHDDSSTDAASATHNNHHQQQQHGAVVDGVATVSPAGRGGATVAFRLPADTVASGVGRGAATAPADAAPLSPVIKVSRGGEMASSMQLEVPREKRKSLRPRHLLNKHLIKRDDEEWQRKRERKKEEKRIHERHRLYHLSYGMMLGMWVCMGKTKSGDPLHIDDFNSVLKLHFRREGTEETPPLELRHSFKFKDYAPKVFRHLREHFGVNADEYKRSLGGFYDFIEFQSNSKSGQFFFFSHDGRFMIKTQTRAESTFLRRIVPHYFRYVVENPGTFLPRFYGMHRIKMAHLGRVTHFTVMHSVFDSSRYDDLMTDIYDLKGSWVGRAATEEEKKRPPGKFVKKDLDLSSPHRVFRVGRERAAAMLAQLRKDTEFLRAMQIMDYSLLVGVRERVTERVVEELSEDLAEERRERARLRAARRRHGHAQGGSGSSSGSGSADDGPGGSAAVVATSSEMDDDESGMEGVGGSSHLHALPPSSSSSSSAAATVAGMPPGSSPLSAPPVATSSAAARARRERRRSRMPRAHVLPAGRHGRGGAAGADGEVHPPTFMGSGLSAFNLPSLVESESEAESGGGGGSSSSSSSAAAAAAAAGESSSSSSSAAAAGLSAARSSSAEEDEDDYADGVLPSPTPLIPPVDAFPATEMRGVPRSHAAVPSVNEDGSEGSEVYYFGIIDILQQYNIRKNLETFGRAFIAPRHGISCVPPAEYARRFVTFLEKHIV